MTRFLTLLTLSLLLAAGCGKKEPASEGSNTPLPTDATAAAAEPQSPEEVFGSFAKAAGEGDWGAAVTMVTEETQTMLVTGMVFQASFMSMEDESKGKELEALFSKHGLSEEMMEAAGPTEEPNFNELVKDLPAFVSDLGKWIEANDKDSEGGFPKLSGVEKIEIDGDRAAGMAVTENGNQPIEFQRIDGIWKVHIAGGPPPQPTMEEMDVDFSDTGDGKIGMMKYGDDSAGLNHAFAYRGKFFDEPCVVLVLTEIEVSDEQKKELEQDLKENDGDAMFFADGPKVQLTLTPDGELLSMFTWIDNHSLSNNRGAVLEVDLTDDKISGKAAMAPKEFNEKMLEFKATFDTPIRF